MSPFQAVFKTKPPIGLSHQGIPDEVDSSIVTEEDYEQVVNEINQTSPQALIPPLHIPSYSLETLYESEQDINNNLFQSNYTDTYLEDISQLPYPSNLLVFRDNSSTYEPQDYSLKFPPITTSCPDIDNYTNSTVNEIQQTASRSTVSPVCQLDTSGAHSCLDCFRYVHIICGRDIGEGFGSFILCNICDLKRNQNNAELTRLELRRKEKQQHQRMLKSSISGLPPADIGDSVSMPISSPDIMTTLGSKNLLGIISDKQDDLYTISTRQGTIKSLYTRNQFEVCPKNILRIDEVPANTISQCSLMRNASLFSTQYCNCKSCKNSRCPCQRSPKHCHSKCHKGRSCQNKL